MRRRGFLAAALAAGIAPAVCKADSLMRIVVPRRAGGRWLLSVGGVLVDDGLLAGDWLVTELSLVEVPLDPCCWIKHTFEPPAVVPAGGLLTLEFDVRHMEHMGLKRLASQRM